MEVGNLEILETLARASLSMSAPEIHALEGHGKTRHAPAKRAAGSWINWPRWTFDGRWQGSPTLPAFSSLRFPSTKLGRSFKCVFMLVWLATKCCNLVDVRILGKPLGHALKGMLWFDSV